VAVVSMIINSINQQAQAAREQRALQQQQQTLQQMEKDNQEFLKKMEEQQKKMNAEHEEILGQLNNSVQMGSGSGNLLRTAEDLGVHGDNCGHGSNDSNIDLAPNRTASQELPKIANKLQFH
jgi:hypothetical protein